MHTCSALQLLAGFPPSSLHQTSDDEHTNTGPSHDDEECEGLELLLRDYYDRAKAVSEGSGPEEGQEGALKNKNKNESRNESRNESKNTGSGCLAFSLLSCLQQQYSQLHGSHSLPFTREPIATCS